MIWGVCLTSLDVLLVLYMQQFRFRYVEALVVLLILGIAGSFAVQLWFARPDLVGVLSGFVPSPEIVRNPDMLYIAVGILGATVMPHNLYLHSSIIQTRRYTRHVRGPPRGGAVRDDRLDRRADVRAVPQRRDPGDGGGDVPRDRP